MRVGNCTRYGHKFNVTNEQNALVQGFTWYTMEIIIAARIYCLDVLWKYMYTFRRISGSARRRFVLEKLYAKRVFHVP